MGFGTRVTIKACWPHVGENCHFTDSIKWWLNFFEICLFQVLDYVWKHAVHIYISKFWNFFYIYLIVVCTSTHRCCSWGWTRYRKYDNETIRENQKGVNVNSEVICLLVIQLESEMYVHCQIIGFYLVKLQKQQILI